MIAARKAARHSCFHGTFERFNVECYLPAQYPSKIFYDTICWKDLVPGNEIGQNSESRVFN